MAFGNGAPDIFSTIASVLSTKKPKASLAIGELLGNFNSSERANVSEHPF